jgi:hypothetical protein
MTPLKVKAYLQSQPRASVEDVAKAFLIDKVLAMQLVSFWESRGHCVKVVACTSCHLACQTQSYYMWV